MHPWLLKSFRVEGPYEVTDALPLHTDVRTQNVVPHLHVHVQGYTAAG